MNRFAIARVVASLVGLAVVYALTDVRSVFEALGAARPGWMLAALAANLAAVACSAALWRAGMVSEGRPSLVHAIRYYLGGMFVNNLTPGTIAGDATRTAMLARRGSPAGAAVASVLGERVLSAAALLFFASIGAAALFTSDPMLAAGVWAGVAAALAAGGVAVVGVEATLRPGRRIPGERLVREARDSIATLARRRAFVARGFGMACGVHVCTVAAAVFTMRALGVQISLAEAFTVVPIIAAAVMLPISLQGVGVREGAYVSLFGVIGVAAEPALAGALLSYATTLAVSLLGAIALAGAPTARPAAPGERDGEAPSRLAA